jgi:alkylation response protein AidB-like acyl-CoA dehydrogenase
MAIAITEEHRLLAETVTNFAEKRALRSEARALLEVTDEPLPSFWSEMAELGWLGIHLDESVGGSGYGLEELVVIVEALGHAVAPGPFLSSVVVSAFISNCGDERAAKWLSGLASGEIAGGFATSSDVTFANGVLSGLSSAVVGGALADLFLIRSGDAVYLVERGEGVSVKSRANLDPSRRSAAVSFTSAPAILLDGVSELFLATARTLLSAEAVGVARATTEMASAYAKERVQFGRVIGTYQAVKHHVANMVVASEMATSAVWDAAMAASLDENQRNYAAAVAATLAGRAADLCANLNTQVHGGIAITWEHDAHLYMRRATTLKTLIDPLCAASDLTWLVRNGVVRTKEISLPPEAEEIRARVRAFAQEIKDLSTEAQRDRLIETGYVMAHWPKPYGRDASAVEQLVIEQEFEAHGIVRPGYGITAWNILTLIQFATEDQAARWVLPALGQDLIWCQLFSEPNAGSDAAGVQTKATRVDGGWLVNGQKVWTSGAHIAKMGFATVRTDPTVAKHDGITTMVIDMEAQGVEVRPLKMTSGNSEFNEVFFTDVFVPDDDVVGPINGGWAVARATLGNESVSIGGGGGGMSYPPAAMVAAFDANPELLDGGASRVGRYIADHQAMGLLNLRAANRAVQGGEPGPEGAMTKLVLSELGHDAASMLTELQGSEALYTDGDAAISNVLVLMHRGMSIAGGTSEIKRNQIGERIAGLPRDPLIK